MELANVGCKHKAECLRTKGWINSPNDMGRMRNPNAKRRKQTIILSSMTNCLTFLFRLEQPSVTGADKKLLPLTPLTGAVRLQERFPADIPNISFLFGSG